MLKDKSSQVEASVIYKSNSVEETLSFGKKLGGLLQSGAVIALVGGLGAGKTWLAKGIAFGLGVPPEEYVNSPAFDLVHEYIGKVRVYHMDFYRLERLSLEDRFWLEEYFDAGGVCIIEWADKFIDELLSSYVRIELRWGDDEDSRILEVASVGADYSELVEKLRLS